MRHINPAKAAIAVGTVTGLWHLMWVVIVALGWAKPVLDFILRLHFIRLDVAVAQFAPGTAALLVGITFALGGLFGLLFAVVWNWLGRDTVRPPISPATSAAQAPQPAVRPSGSPFHADQRADRTT